MKEHPALRAYEIATLEKLYSLESPPEKRSVVKARALVFDRELNPYNIDIETIFGNFPEIIRYSKKDLRWSAVARKSNPPSRSMDFIEFEFTTSRNNVGVYFETYR